MIPIQPRRFLAVVASAAGACAIAVPAVLGLSGNPSFSQRIPVGVPSSAQRVTVDGHGSALTIIDGRRHHKRPTRTPSAGDDRSTHTEPGDDRSTHTEPGEDRSTHTEPGDDRDGHNGGRHGHGGDDRGGPGDHGNH